MYERDDVYDVLVAVCPLLAQGYQIRLKHNRFFMNKDYKNMRGFKRVFMIELVEGEGVQGDPSRIVKYFYDDDTEFLAKYDPCEKKEDSLKDPQG